MAQKECKKCGLLTNESETSCLYCGGQEFVPPRPKKKKAIKRFFPLICFALVLTAFLVFALVLDEAVTSDVYEEVDASEKVNFDLSEYDSYGNLSCGRIWVKKTISDWDKSPEQYFAYLDANGNVIYDWTPVGSYYYKGSYLDSVLPQDFKNGYAMIINRAVGEKTESGVYFIDLDGNVLYDSVSIIVAHYLDDVGAREDLYITDFDDEHYAYFVGRILPEDIDNGNWDLFWMDKDGVHRFNYDFPNTDTVTRSVERINGYFFVSCGAYSVLLDSLGNPIIDFPEVSGITPYEIELLDDNQIKVYFEGMDSNDYQCILNYEGEFLTEPTRVE